MVSGFFLDKNSELTIFIRYSDVYDTYSSFFSLNVQANLHILGSKHTQTISSQLFLTDENKMKKINKIDTPKQLNISFKVSKYLMQN